MKPNLVKLFSSYFILAKLKVEVEVWQCMDWWSSSKSEFSSNVNWIHFNHILSEV